MEKRKKKREAEEADNAKKEAELKAELKDKQRKDLQARLGSKSEAHERDDFQRESKRPKRRHDSPGQLSPYCVWCLILRCLRLVFEILHCVIQTLSSVDSKPQEGI